MKTQAEQMQEDTKEMAKDIAEDILKIAEYVSGDDWEEVEEVLMEIARKAHLQGQNEGIYLFKLMFKK